jgi:putative addiction module component (TIGR02574 family)
MASGNVSGKEKGMASPARQIEAKAMKLPARARARLAERLIASLDDHTDRDAEHAWVREGERRLDELRSGKVKGRSAAGVFRRARAALR